MIIQEQDIIMLRNITFKSPNIIDTSITGHPVLIIKVTDTHFYFLTISSSSYKTLHRSPNQHFVLKKSKSNHLKVPMNFINLKNIYKEEINNYVPFGFVNDQMYKKVIEKLKYYQENIKEDELYKEIKEDELYKEIKDKPKVLTKKYNG